MHHVGVLFAEGRFAVAQVKLPGADETLIEALGTNFSQARMERAASGNQGVGVVDAEPVFARDLQSVLARHAGKAGR